jgi:anaerobic selenocysteine-containing dehydrogenase
MPKSISRRGFLKLTAAGAATSVLAGCKRPGQWVVLEPYVKPPEEQLTGQATWYASTCRQCPAGCGIIVRIMNGRAVKIEGNPEHPLNRGKLCARGQAGLQVLYNPDRLNAPVRQDSRNTGNFQAIAWDEGLNTLLAKLQSAGSEILFWLGSTTSAHLYEICQLFAQAVGAPDPLVFDLYSGFNGYAAIGEAQAQLFGQDWLPAYDLSQADVVYSFGADLVGPWLSSTRYGIEFGAFRSQSLGKRGYLAQFEPRMSTTGAKADRWLPLNPGTEGLVAQAIARLIADHSYGALTRQESARTLAPQVDINAIAQATGITLDVLDQMARIFAEAEHPLAIPGVPAPGYANAFQAIEAVQTLNMIAGNLGQPGGMYLAPADTDLPPARPTPASPGQVQSMIDRMRAGKVQALLVYGANPAYELPAQSGFIEAMQQVPFIVSFAPMVDETAVWADMVLPDRTYLESWGYEVVAPVFDLPVVGSQQPVVEPVFDNRATADILLTVAKGIPAAALALPWEDEVAFIKETISKLPPGAQGGISSNVRWARFQQHGGWWPVATSEGLVPAVTATKLEALPAVPFEGSEQDYPYYLYLYMNDLLSDGRGANQPWLQGSPDTNTSISWQTWIELNPLTAQQLNIKQGDIVQVTSPFGELEAPVYLYPAVRPDTVAIPLGQGHTQYGRYARERGSNAIQLLGVEQSASPDQVGWITPRVKLTPTGKRAALATFEDTVGVTEGFINQSFPGQ